MIKIHLKYELDRKQLQAIAMIAPLATISIIDDSRVVRKFRAKLGNFVEGRIVCGNQNCITNVVFEPVENKHKYLGNNFFQCHYCEKMDTLDLIYNEKRFIYVE
jgi:aspartate carbamoyltransferase regulatory subunit